MKLATMAKILVTGLALFFMVVEVAANDPIFVKWLVIDDPGDETIRYYWQMAEAEELGAEELVDLGTMLFYRGWSNDAVTYFKRALDINPELSEAWFRIGLVKHQGGDLSGAESAYKKCLKRQSGHGWANFYLGLLEETTGKVGAAMEHYQTAFKHAPELANPRVNPEILSSRLQLGAQVKHFDRERFENHMPMPVLAPETLRMVRRGFNATPTPEPTAVPAPIVGPQAVQTPTPVQQKAKVRNQKTGKPAAAAGVSASGASSGGAATGRSRSAAPTAPTPGASENTPFGYRAPPPNRGGTESTGSPAPKIGDTSPEASLRPFWPRLYDLAEALV
jgi:hypothetical protein